MIENGQKDYQDCWLYILLLTTLTILVQALRRYSFTIFSSSISFGILLLPGVYFLSNYILKRYDYKKAIAAIAISGVISLGFHAVIAYFMNRNMILTNSCGDFCAYVVSQFIHLLLYDYLWNHSKKGFLFIFLSYFLSTIVYFIFYTLIYLYIVIYDGFWMSFFITIIIEGFICILFTVIDKKIK